MGWGKRLLATGVIFMGSATAVLAAPGLDQPQSDALRLLAPFFELQHLQGGSIALQRNLLITGQIQDGSAHQPLLLPFAKQQRQALADAFMTTGNASQLADGLGSELAGIYQKKACYAPSNDWKGQEKSNIPATITGVLKFA